ncbi:hypothetical protein GCM10027426_25100 [Microbacterium lacusdiani]
MRLRQSLGTLSRTWTFVGVGLLGAVVLVLSALALTQHRGTPPAAESPSETRTPTESPEPTTSATPSAEPEAPAAVAPTRHLTQLTTGTLIRSTSGECGGSAPTVEFSTDAGATWTPGDTSAAGASQVLRLLSGDIGQAITLDATCAPSGMWSFSEGAAWEQAADLVGGSWYFNPGAPTTVHAPAGDVPLPCTALALSAFDTTAIALCDDATVVTTADNAATWSAPVPAPGALTVHAAADGFRVMIDGAAAQCAGVQVAALTDGAIASPGACLPAEFAPGDVALAAGGDGTVVVWAGDVVGRSADGGANWG